MRKSSLLGGANVRGIAEMDSWADCPEFRACPLLQVEGLRTADAELDGVDLSVGYGEIAAVIGPQSGALLRAIAGERGTRGGTIRFGGGDLTWSRSVRRTKLGLVLARAQPERDVGATLSRFAFLNGGGGDPALNERLATIGEALADHPRLLLLDEPTRGLTARARWRMLAAFLALNDRGVSLLVADRCAELVSLADTVHVIHGGRVVRVISAA